jgi:hypothetical protein
MAGCGEPDGEENGKSERLCGHGFSDIIVVWICLGSGRAAAGGTSSEHDHRANGFS